MAAWDNMVKSLRSAKKGELKIGIIGKYLATGSYELIDSYASLNDALAHASIHQHLRTKIVWINSEQLEKLSKKEIDTVLSKLDAIIVPIGWGPRGVEGKIKAISYARTHKVPYLGLCYGMQLASVEYARNVLGLKDANSTEVNPNTQHPVIYSIPFDKKYQKIKSTGVSMRLGAYDCVLKEGTLAHKIYSENNSFKDAQKGLISERHRHRFEFNNAFRKQFEDAGFVISGTSPDDFFVEVIELPKKVHPFFIATQGHPEYKSRPLHPHPIFTEFLKAAYSKKT